jgi:hypothetical protein
MYHDNLETKLLGPYGAGEVQIIDSYLKKIRSEIYGVEFGPGLYQSTLYCLQRFSLETYSLFNYF